MIKALRTQGQRRAPEQQQGRGSGEVPAHLGGSAPALPGGERKPLPAAPGAAASPTARPPGTGGDIRGSVATGLGGDTRCRDDPAALTAAGVRGRRAPGPAGAEMLASGTRTSHTCDAAKGKKTAVLAFGKEGGMFPRLFSWSPPSQL